MLRAVRCWFTVVRKSASNVKKKINRRQRSVRIGVDTGGTFTDFVFEADGDLRVFKLASTPDDPSRAISEGLKQSVAETGAPLNAVEVVHGTTVGTNALLQRRGARAALVTTAGFEDVIEIGREERPEVYNLKAVRPVPLVRRELWIGASARVAASGEVLETLGEEGIAALVDKLRRAKPESIAISLLFSFVHPEHEKRIAAAVVVLGVPLSVSHQILPEYREYERTATVVINAYLQPLMGRYLNRLGNGGREESGPESSSDPSPKSKAQRSSFGLRVMQSSGGSISASAAAAEPVRTILSGPAGGVVAALRAAQAAHFTNIITFDMGGTSTDVALCDSDA